MRINQFVIEGFFHRMEKLGYDPIVTSLAQARRRSFAGEMGPEGEVEYKEVDNQQEMEEAALRV